MRIDSLAPLDLERGIHALGELLHACVHAGASVGYVLPFGLPEAEEFWRKSVLPALEAKGRIVLVLREGEATAGTVQLDVDTPPNQPHRAEVRKLLVHPAYRRRGLARLLMGEIEARARDLGRTLLTLDTRTGDAAEPLYASLGYVAVGSIPGYCRDPFGPRFDATTIMYKTL